MRNTLIAIAAFVVAAPLTAVAGQYDHRYSRPHGPVRGQYYEGQRYRGHVLHSYHGRWGYYRPRNGVNVFISL